MAALRGAAQPIELEIDEAEIVGACSDVRGKTQHAVPGGPDQRHLDRGCIAARDPAFEGLVDRPARLEPDESRSKIVSPTAEGLISVMRLGQPFHGRPKRCGLPRARRGKANPRPKNRQSPHGYPPLNPSSPRKRLAVCRWRCRREAAA